MKAAREQSFLNLKPRTGAKLDPTYPIGQSKSQGQSNLRRWREGRTLLFQGKICKVPGQGMGIEDGEWLELSF